MNIIKHECLDGGAMAIVVVETNCRLPLSNAYVKNSAESSPTIVLHSVNKPKAPANSLS